MKKLLFIIFYGLFFSYSLGSEGNKSFISTYEPENSGDFFIENTRILTGTGEEIINGSILISKNKIKANWEEFNKTRWYKDNQCRGKVGYSRNN